MRYWLMKSEPESYSIEDLKREKRGCWDGVRNYQARNFMRDEMSIGDKVLFYHSNAKPPGVAGLAEVCSGPYPDHTAWDRLSAYYSARSTPDNPLWVMVDIKFVEEFERLVTLEEIRLLPECGDMVLLHKGQRLSIQPIEKRHYEAIKRASGRRP